MQLPDIIKGLGENEDGMKRRAGEGQKQNGKQGKAGQSGQEGGVVKDAQLLYKGSLELQAN
jgi:hypothetical protein